MNNICIAAGNIDRDSIRVQFKEHKLEFTNPIIIAAIASPPYFSDIAAAEPDYNYLEWETAYGTTSTTGSSSGTSLGFSVGLTVEFEQEVSFFGIKGAQFKASAAFSNTLDWTVEESYSVSKSKTYVAYGGKNRIVFSSIPVDTYSYTVLDNPTDTDSVGTIVTISLPRDFSIYSVEQDFYNANNGVLADIGTEIFPHTLGDPFTYPTKAQKDTLTTGNPKGYASDLVTPAQGDGVTELSIVVGSGKDVTQSWESATDLEIGGGAGGVSVLGTFGFHAGLSTTTSTSTDTEFSGTAGNLPTKYFNNPNYAYSQGLFVYPYKSTAGNYYWVLNYWVE